MIRVEIDLSCATAAEAAAFFALPGVGRAVDAMSHPTDDAALQLRVLTPALGATPPAFCGGEVRASLN